MPKSIEDLKQDLAKDAFGTDRRGSMAQRTCVQCKKDADTFRDDVSRREYEISGFCQACQDDYFG